MKTLTLTICLICFAFSSYSQYTLTDNDGETIYTNTGTISTGAYTPGQVYTLTICSDDPLCSHITVIFSDLIIASGNFCVYDGNATSSPIMACSSWYGVPDTVTASVNNVIGCLTFQFSSPDPGAVISGTINCNFSCQSTLASVLSTDPPAVYSDGSYYIDVCQGQDISFNGQGIYQNTTYPQSDATSTFFWDFGDGITSSSASSTHTYTNGQGYEIDLIVTDNQGCSSTNNISYRVRVSQTPSFSGTFASPVTACQGDTITLTGNVSSEEFVNYSITYDSFLAHIPDGTGESLSLSMVYDIFEPGQTLEDIEDMCGICVNMEHSFIGDLIITITCPFNTLTGTATTVELEYHHGGGTYLGIPVDDDASSEPGIGWEYCWTYPADADYLQDLGDYAGSVSTLPSGSYITSEPLDPLIGCELNGEWILTITDNWSPDDGYVFGWNMCFDPSILPEQWSYQNSYPAMLWSPSGAEGMMFSENTGTYDELGDATTEQSFIFTVTDDFGCSHDTAIFVTFLGDTVSPCNTSGLDDYFTGEIADISFNIYPNPITDYITIEYFAQDNLPLTCYIIDATGKLLLTEALKNTSSGSQKISILDVKSLPPANYFLILNYNNNNFLRKIIIN